MDGANQVTATIAGVAEDKLSSIENVTGTQQGDQITGDGLANTLNGMSGSDMLSAGAGADTLIGGFGNDRLIGGDGIDALTGGGGLDTFVLANLSVSRDIIRDFVASDDTLEISASLFGGGLTAGTPLTSDQLVRNDTGLAGDADDRFILNTLTGELEPRAFN